MVDITIIPRREAATVVAETRLGERWLNNNIHGGYLRILTIPSDTVEDFVKDLEAEGLEVEVK